VLEGEVVGALIIESDVEDNLIGASIKQSP